MTLGRAKAPPHPPLLATSNDGILPFDLLYEILLRLPTVPICRFRAVCRSWRSMLCHLDFIAAAQNPGPLLAVGVKDCFSSNEFNVMDVESGDTVKLVNVASDVVPYTKVLSMNLDCMVSVVAPNNRIQLIDLANDIVCLLPEYKPPYQPTQWCIVGRTTSTGEHKVLTIAKYEKPQVCKILTIGNNLDWRDIGHPPLKVLYQARSFAVINGFAYFLSDYKMLHPHKIMVFDLSRETWRPTTSFQAPLKRHCVSLADLRSHLVASYYIHNNTSIEMWFLEDSNMSNWSKRYTMTLPCSQNLFPNNYFVGFVKPLALLDDSRIVMWMRVDGIGAQNEVLWIYDQQIKTFTDRKTLPKCSSVRLFAWSLLRPGRRSAIDMAAERLLMDRRHHRSEAASSIEGTNKKRQTSDLL